MMPAIMNLGAAVLILAGLLLPGYFLARGASWPMPWLAGGVISSLAIFGGVLLLTGCGVPVTGASLGLWQAVLALAGMIYWRSRNPEPTLTPGGGRGEWWLALPALPMAAVAVWRALYQPLSGADVGFRWNHLAEMIVGNGGLAHYPPVTAVDFTHYFWPDGIAPLLSGLYAWTYLVAGSTERMGRGGGVWLQGVGVFGWWGGGGGGWGGERGGWFACALGGGTMLLQFSFNLGQETGLTALGVGGLAYYLLVWERSKSGRDLLPAAACAALAAGAREYGLVFPLVAAGWLLMRKAGWRRTLFFGSGALVLPALWHLRNWVHTGNPLYALDVAGVFPVNPVFRDWMQSYIEIYGAPLWRGSGWVETGRLLALTALPALLGLLFGAVFWRRTPGWALILTLAGATVACWLASVPFTAGGLFYSMRVLSPLLLLGCAWGGAVLARWVPGRRHLAGVWLGCLLFGGDAALRAWTIPQNPYRLEPSAWPTAGYVLQQDFTEQLKPFLAAAARTASGRVLTEVVVAPEVFRPLGVEAVPVWSPAAAVLFAPGDDRGVADRLRAEGFSHILLSRVPSTANFLERTGVLRRLEGRLQPVMANDTFVLFALQP